MFTPATSSLRDGPALGTRSRRRQRPTSTENLHLQPKAKRARLPLAETTFLNPEVASRDTYEVKPMKPSKTHIEQDGPESITAPVKKESSVRSKKQKAGERATKGDGSVILTTNNAYVVSKLPALPDRLRADANVQIHGSLESNGYALSLSHTHAIVWPYAAAIPSPETFTFTLPYPSARASDPLPLGALVSASASSLEPGLVIVMPVSGKITYWESISSAATLDLMRQQRNGVEDAVSGMFHNEIIVQLVNAEPAGFILALSSGRVAHMNVRDTQGRPSISVQFLRGSLGSTPSGIFGSLKTVFSHTGTRGDIVAVRCDRSSTKRGERIVVAATARGKIHGWKVQRTGAHDTMVDLEIRDAILTNIHNADPSRSSQYSADSLEVIDFTFAPKGIEHKFREMTRLNGNALADDASQQLVILVSLTNQSRAYYCLCELVLSASSIHIGMVRPITTYSIPSNTRAFTKPRLYIPKPALVAYIAFDRAVVIASIVGLPESPESQLQEDSHIVPSTFEDVIDLQQDSSLEIVASGLEETTQVIDEPRSHKLKAKNPAVVALVKGAGILRIATNDIDRFGRERPSKVTARSKLEQAVVYGIKGDHLLTFSGHNQHEFTDRELCDAAIELSNDIVASRLSVFSTMTSSMEGHMQARADALNRLISHLNVMQAQMDRTTRWILLQNAEKMTVAAFLWRLHEQYTQERVAENMDPKTLIAEIVEFIHEDQKKDPNRKAGELDRVRHWFTHDVWRLEIFLAWAYEAVKYLYKERVKDDINLARCFYEAADVGCAALKGALDYRQQKMSFYGLDPEDLHLGVLAGGYEGLPEPWTATKFIANNIGRTVELCERLLDGPDKTGHEQVYRQHISDLLPSLTDHWLVALLEYTRWAFASTSSDNNDHNRLKYAHEFQKAYDNRHAHIVKLINYGTWEETLKVAEKHGAKRAMAEIMIHEAIALKRRHEDPLDDDKDGILPLIEKVNGLLSKCFDQYGEKFAFAAYEVLLRLQGVEAVLDFKPDQYGYATRFLRATPGLDKISWIHDVEKEKDIDHAAETLVNLGLSSEQRVWNKKIQLSLGKLALMAEGGIGTTHNDDPVSFFSLGKKRALHSRPATSKEERIVAINHQLDIIKIQDGLYESILPTIRTAVGDDEEVSETVKVYGSRVQSMGNKTLRTHFEAAIKSLVRQETLDPLTLIDLLTLLDFPESIAAAREELFFQAVRMAILALKGEEQRNTLKLIWRRQYLCDDWPGINKQSSSHTDESLQEVQASTSLFQTCWLLGRNCPDPNINALYKNIPPSQLLGLYAKSLDKRFEHSSPGVRKKMMEAMQKEDTMLRDLLDHHRLQQWVHSTADLADKLVAQELDQETQLGAAASASLVSQDQKPATINGSASLLNST